VNINYLAEMHLKVEGEHVRYLFPLVYESPALIYIILEIEEFSAIEF